MPRRGRNEGSIYRRKDGRWAAVVDLGWENGKRKRKTFYGKTRQDIARKLVAALREQQLGLPVATERQNLKQYLDYWMEVTSNTVKPRTYERYEEIIRLHIVPTLGKLQLAKLTPQHLNELYLDKIECGLAPNTVKRIHEVLHNALNQALQWDLLYRNVADSVSPPRVQKMEPKTLTAEESKKLLRAAEDDRLGALYVMALTMGMRQGELLGLHWEDVDLQRKQVHVRFNLQRSKRKGLIYEETKSHRSRRPLMMPQIGVDSLKRHKARQAEERLKLGAAWLDGDLVFTNSVGGPVDADNLRHRAFPTIIKNAGIPEMKFHELRHSTATLLASLGVHPKVIQEIMGHSQISVTMDTYSHVLPVMHGEAIEKLNELLDSGTSEVGV